MPATAGDHEEACTNEGGRRNEGEGGAPSAARSTACRDRRDAGSEGGEDLLDRREPRLRALGQTAIDDVVPARVEARNDRAGARRRLGEPERGDRQRALAAERVRPRHEV